MFDPDAVRGAVIEYLSHNSFSDISAVTSKVLRKHVERSLNLPPDSLKTATGTGLLVQATSQYSALVQQHQKFEDVGDASTSAAAKEQRKKRGRPSSAHNSGELASTTTNDSLGNNRSDDLTAGATGADGDDSGGGSDDDSDDSERADGDAAVESAPSSAWKRGKFSKLEGSIIRREVQRFAAQSGMDVEQLAPYFREQQQQRDLSGGKRTQLRTNLWGEIQGHLPNRTRRVRRYHCCSFNDSAFC